MNRIWEPSALTHMHGNGRVWLTYLYTQYHCNGIVTNSLKCRLLARNDVYICSTIATSRALIDWITAGKLLSRPLVIVSYTIHE